MLKIFSLGIALAAALSTEVSSMPVPLVTDLGSSSKLIQGNAIDANSMLVAFNANTATQIDPTTVLGVAAIGTGTAGLVWKATHESAQSASDSRQSLRIENAKPQLQKKLLRLLHNDREAANRLLAGVKLNHPDKSVNWVAEKVIYDLERDLGRY